jgi:nucleoside-diphosphate-sugar epimerase
MVGRVLVTGATGFLGGALLRKLRAEGAEVLGMGRDAGRAAGLSLRGSEVLALDLSNPVAPDLLQRLGPVDAVVHCAARSAPHGRMRDFEAANVQATRHVIALARALGVRRFVFVSSSSVSFRPADQLGLREGDPLPEPFNAYARTKRAGEDLVLAARALGPIVLRPRGIYGTGDTALLPRLLRAARRGPLPLLRQGRARIDLTHIDDAVASILAALEVRAVAEGQVFNVSGGEVLPVTQIAEQAAARAGVGLRWRRMPLSPLMAVAGLVERAALLLPGAPEPAVTRYGLALFAYAQSLDLTQAATGLGWRPQVSFEEGLVRTFAKGPPP